VKSKTTRKNRPCWGTEPGRAQLEHDLSQIRSSCETSFQVSRKKLHQVPDPTGEAGWWPAQRGRTAWPSPVPGVEAEGSPHAGGIVQSCRAALQAEDFQSSPTEKRHLPGPHDTNHFVLFTEEEMVGAVEPLARSWAPHLYDKHPRTCINSVWCLCTSHALAAQRWSGEKILFFNPKKSQEGTNKQVSKITSSPLHQAKVWIRRLFLGQLPI